MADFKIAPSILSADFARLGEEVDNVLASGADIVHFDVMDNHYVPNLTIGPLVCEALRKHGVTAEIDVHLMVKPVDRIIPDFAKAGATFITFHPEASDHIDRSLQLVQNEGCKTGLVFNPATPLSLAEHVLDKVDRILLMSVNPGFGGQSFIPHTLDKLREARKMIDASGYDIDLEIDGGVNVKNIREIAEAGARTFVAGSAVFGAAQKSDETMKALDLPTRGEAKVRNWVGNGVPRLIERALVDELNSKPTDNLYQKSHPIFMAYYAENPSTLSQLYPDVKTGLDWLQSQNILLGCVTNKDARFTDPILQNLGIRDYFNIVISGDTLPVKKPDPAPLLHGAEFFGVPVEQSMMIGDSINDVKASRAAGFSIVCMSYGYNHGIDIRTAEPDAVIDSFAELAGLF